jgi:hypothetical protein
MALRAARLVRVARHSPVIAQRGQIKIMNLLAHATSLNPVRT